MGPFETVSFYSRLSAIIPKPLQIKKEKSLKKISDLIDERIHFITPREAIQLSQLKRKLIKNKIKINHFLILKIENILSNFKNFINIDEAPDDILYEIFKFLRNELYSIQFVSKTFHRVSTVFLEKKKQLSDNWTVAPLKQIIRTLPFFGYTLKSLHFSHADFNDNDLSRAIKSCPLVTEIYLEQCTQLTNQGLVSLRELKFLKVLTLRQCFKCTPETFESLSHLSGLQEMALINVEQIKIEISQERFHLFISSLPNLDVLRLFPIEPLDFSFIKLINPVMKVW